MHTMQRHFNIINSKVTLFGCSYATAKTLYQFIFIEKKRFADSLMLEQG